MYNSLLTDFGDMITLPPKAPWVKNVYWMYSILLEDNFLMSREKLMQELQSEGIETRTFFYPVHVQPLYKELGANESFPISDELSRKGINLPSGNNLKKEDIKRVCDTIIKLAK